MTDLTALKDFLVLCQTKSFSRAAERCHVSVSGLSRRIQGLEIWLGTPVFDRTKTALELTDAGRRLEVVAVDVVSSLDDLRTSLRMSRDGRNQQIRFAAPHIMSALFFPQWIPRLHSDFREAKFNVMSDYLPECFAALREGVVDFVVALVDENNAVLQRAGLRQKVPEFLNVEIGQEKLIPVSAPDAAGRPLFNLDRVSPTGISFLSYSDECSLGWAVEHALMGFPSLNLQREHENNLADGLRGMAVSRLGLAWLPETLVRPEMAAKALLRAGGVRFDINMSVSLYRREALLSTQAAELWEEMKKNIPRSVEEEQRQVA